MSFVCKIVIIFLSISLDAQKNHLIEMVLLSTLNIFFDEKQKAIF